MLDSGGPRCYAIGHWPGGLGRSYLEGITVGEWTDHLTADGVKMDSQRAADAEAAAQASVVHAADLDRIAELEALLEPQVPPVPDPPPDPTTSMWVGSSLYTPGGETLQQGYDRRCSEWGVSDLEMVRYFFPGMPTGWPQFGSAATIVSFKVPNYDMKGFAAGKYDTQTKAWLNSLPRDGKARRIAFWHEREDEIASGKFTFADALAADEHMMGLIQDANSRNGTNLKFGLILMGWSLDPASGRDVNKYFPRQGTFTYDYVGWDAYPGNSFSMDLPNLLYTETLFTRCAEATAAHGAKNWYICETGTSNKGHSLQEYDTMQADWIEGAFTLARELKCKGITYWDSVTGAGQQNNYQIQGPKAKAAIGAEIKMR